MFIVNFSTVFPFLFFSISVSSASFRTHTLLLALIDDSSSPKSFAVFAFFSVLSLYLITHFHWKCWGKFSLGFLWKSRWSLAKSSWALESNWRCFSTHFYCNFASLHIFFFLCHRLFLPSALIPLWFLWLVDTQRNAISQKQKKSHGKKGTRNTVPR